jgi:hypothetical protein
MNTNSIGEELQKNLLVDYGSAANDDKNVPEQTAMTVDTEG